MKRLYKILLAVLAVIIVVLAVTCPGRRAHKDAVINKYQSGIIKDLGIDANDPQNQKNLKIGEEFMERVINPNLKVLGYGVCSIGYLETVKGRKKISFGILGHVYLLDAEHLHARLFEMGKPQTEKQKN